MHRHITPLIPLALAPDTDPDLHPLNLGDDGEALAVGEGEDREAVRVYREEGAGGVDG